MKIIIRADASANIGSGHIMRCLSLAEELKQRGFQISFICREEIGNLIELIKKKGFNVFSLPSLIDIKTDAILTKQIIEKYNLYADWLIVDNYEIDINYEVELRQFTKKILVIDDLANRKHDCDILLDQNYVLNNNRYDGLLPEICKQLIGTDFALLRKQFFELRKKLQPRSGKIEQVLVFMGGADFTSETGKILEAIKLFNNPNITFNIVIGPSNQQYEKLKSEISKIPNVTCLYNVDNMADLMINADLCIGASGSTNWERCCLGLPSLIIVIADNQKEIASALDKRGCVINLGWHDNVTSKNIVNKLKYLIDNPKVVKQMSLESQKIIDGNGTIRVINELLKAGKNEKN